MEKAIDISTRAALMAFSLRKSPRLVNLATEEVDQSEDDILLLCKTASKLALLERESWAPDAWQELLTAEKATSVEVSDWHASLNRLVTVLTLIELNAGVVQVFCKLLVNAEEESKEMNTTQKTIERICMNETVNWFQRQSPASQRVCLEFVISFDQTVGRKGGDRLGGHSQLYFQFIRQLVLQCSPQVVAEEEDLGKTLVKISLEAIRSGDAQQAQDSLDLLLPVVLPRFGMSMQGDELLDLFETRSNACKQEEGLFLWQAMLVGFCAACMQTPQVGIKLIDPILVKHYDLIWGSIKTELIVNDFREQKRAMFLVKAILTMKDCADQRWDALCDILDALDLMEVHHTKDNWSRIEFLMLRHEHSVPNVPDLDLSWAKLPYIKAARHGNFAVRKVPVKNFLEDWERYIRDDHKFVRISADFLFDTLLHSINERDLFRVCVSDDATGQTSSLFGIEEAFPRLFRLWFENLTASQSIEERASLLQTYVHTLASLPFGSNNMYALTLVDALLAIPKEWCPSWLGEQELQALSKQFLGGLSWMTESVEFYRVMHSIFKRIPDVVTVHGDPESIDGDTLVTLFSTARIANWPDVLKRTSKWVCSHENLREKILDMIRNSLLRGYCGSSAFFRPQLASDLWGMLADDPTALQSSLKDISEILVSVYSQPYLKDDLKHRACVLFTTFVNAWLSYDECFCEALVWTVERPELVEQVTSWCSLLLSCAPGQTEMWLLEQYFSTTLEPGAQVGSSALAVVESLSRVLSTYKSSSCGDILAAFVEKHWDCTVSSLIDSNELVPACRAIKILKHFAPLARRYLGSQALSLAVQTLTQKSLADLLPTAPPQVVSRSNLMCDSESNRWMAVLELLKNDDSQQAVVLDATSQQNALEMILEVLDRSNDSLRAILFDALKSLLSFETPFLEKAPWEDVWQACLAGFNSSEKKSPQWYLSFVETVMHPHLFRNEAPLVRKMWKHVKSNDNAQGFAHLALAKHIVGNVLWENPSLVRPWLAELVDLVQFAPDRSTHQNVDTQTMELCHVVKTPYDSIKGVPIHPLSFVRLQVMALFDKVFTVDSDDLDAERIVDSCLESIGYCLDALLLHEKNAKRNSIHCPEGYAKSHLWDLVNLLSLKLSKASGGSLRQSETRALFQRLLKQFFSASCNYRQRAGLELTLMNLVLSPDVHLTQVFFDFFETLHDAKKSMVLSGLFVIAVLAYEAVHDTHKLWGDATRLALLEKISALALPLAGSGEILIRTVAGNIVSVSYPVLHAMQVAQQGKGNGLVQHTGRIMQGKLAGNLLNSVFMEFDPQVEVSVDWHISRVCNAYGNEILNLLSHRVSNAIDAYLMDKHDKVRAVVAKKTALPQDYKSIVEREAKKLATESAANSSHSASSSGDEIRQQKFDPWTSWSSFLTLMSMEQSVTTRYRELYKGKRGNLQQLIVVTSLLDSVASVAALARTSEIFAAKSFIVSDLSILQETLFEQIAVSADKWLDFQAVPPSSLSDFLVQCKDAGYVVVGLEQGRSESCNLHEFTFPQHGRTVLVCSNEPQGLPVPVIQCCDALLRIPSQGTTRTLIPHISGAIAIWEATSQHLFSCSKS